MNYDDPGLKDRLKARLLIWLAPVQGAAITWIHRNDHFAGIDDGYIVMLFGALAALLSVVGVGLVRVVARKFDDDGDGTLTLSEVSDDLGEEVERWIA